MLMATGRVWVRYENRGAACRGELEDRGARSGEHQIRGREHVAEVRDVFEHLNPIPSTGRCDTLHDHLVVAPPRYPEDPEPRVGLQQAIGNGRVDREGSLASAEDRQDARRRVDA